MGRAVDWVGFEMLRGSGGDRIEQLVDGSALVTLVVEGVHGGRRREWNDVAGDRLKTLVGVVVNGEDGEEEGRDEEEKRNVQQ